MKELLITAGGENVAPIPIEDTMKKELPILSNAMVVGDRKKFLSCLLTFKVETDPDTMEPKDTLTKASKVRILIFKLARSASTVQELLGTVFLKV